jgi:hypothetical protein
VRIRNLYGGITIVMLGACSAGGGGTEPTPPAQSGELRMTLVRSTSSSVPAAADSALVRVWHPMAGTNQVQRVAIPAPGASTQVSFNLPARSGYSVGVVAFRVNPAANVREVLAGGRTADVTVSGGQTSQAAINVVPWQMTLAGPDTLISGEPAALTATVSGGPVADFFVEGFFHVGLSPWASLSSLPTSLPGTLVGNQLNGSIVAPTVQADTAVHIQMDLRMNGNDWQSTNLSLIAFLPSLTLGESLIRRPLRVPNGGLIVTFDREATP